MPRRKHATATAFTAATGSFINSSNLRLEAQLFNSLVEADGSLRTVKYTADAVNGFNAIVEHSGGAAKTYAAPARLAPVAAYTPVAPPAFVAPKIALPQPYALHGGSSSVHTSFSAPHASYHY